MPGSSLPKGWHTEVNGRFLVLDHTKLAVRVKKSSPKGETPKESPQEWCKHRILEVLEVPWEGHGTALILVGERINRKVQGKPGGV